MNNHKWQKFFEICSITLGEGSYTARNSDNWCAWITFERLHEDMRYWRHGLPAEDEFDARGVKDGGVWGQPFNYDEIAHIVLPRKFTWESFDNNEYRSGTKIQDIDLVSALLTKNNIKHRCNDLILEIKLY